MLKKLIFWEYPRASWQYDVIVALILAFIFLTPRSLFNDQPRANQVAMMSEGHFLVEPAALKGLTPAGQAAKAAELIERRYRAKVRVASVQPVVEEEEIRGYAVTTTK